MARKWMAGGLLVASLASVADAETVFWQIAAAAGSGRRHVLANGVKTYTPEADVHVQTHLRRRDGAVVWSKSLPLTATVAVSARVRRERRLDGFGLVIHRRGDQNGFSWNWFERGKDGEYRRRRHPGRVTVTTRKGSDYEELESVEFLEDVPLLYLDDVRRPPGAHSHEVVIRKGSVLRFGVAAPSDGVRKADAR